MIPSAFQYVRASSVDDALARLAGSADAVVLAGGHSLIPAMKLRLNDPSLLVDISRLDELRGIRVSDSSLVVGALTTHRSVETSGDVKNHCRVLADVAAGIGDPQVRNLGTIGGSLAHADPAADYPAIVLALDASITARGPSGSRSIGATDFFRGLFETALAPGELITEVAFPVVGPGEGASYSKFANPASKYAVVGIAAWVALDGQGVCTDARVGVTGATAQPHRAPDVEARLRGARLEAASIAAASDGFASADSMLSDLGGSSEYRAHLCSVMARRAITAAAAHAST